MGVNVGTVRGATDGPPFLLGVNTMSSDEADDDDEELRTESEGVDRGDQLVDSVRFEWRLLIRGVCSSNPDGDGGSSV